MRRSPRWLAAAGVCAGAVALGGCGIRPPVRAAACAPALPVAAAGEGRRRVAQLSVLTYNIEGLGWPARSGRAPALREIGERLDALRREGRPPDIVLFQEVFSNAAKRAVAASGFPAIAAGPRRTTRADGAVPPPLPGKTTFHEWGIHFVGSGLAVASRFPIVEQQQRAYGRRACAGRDCLANKGIMLARIAVAGLPTTIDVYNTHMNSRVASRAPEERHVAAHDRQSLAAAEFIRRTRAPASPIIFGGDFNMRHSERRWRTFTRYQPLALVHRFCGKPHARCDVRLSWDGDAPWMDTQDLQFFGRGTAMTIRPVRVESAFDGSVGSPRLSDHDGFMVTYELSWAASRTPDPRLKERAPRCR